MALGGKRPGAGRKPGGKNKLTVARAQAVAEAAEKIAEVLPEAFAGDAHALLMAVYKDPTHEWALRVDAAKAAVRYEKPALSSIDATVVVEKPRSFDLTGWSEEKLDAFERLLDEAEQAAVDGGHEGSA